MKSLLFILLLTIDYQPSALKAQELPSSTEGQIETLADVEETEDDSYLQQLEQFRKNPVDLNRADESELKELKIINDLQIESLVSYRKLFGRLIDIYELQAVPSWDVVTIRKLLPFITLSSALPVKEDLAIRFRKGEHSLLLRASQVLERSKGFDRSSSGSTYRGSQQKIFFRYRYSYKNVLQFGLVGDKDAGEQFLKGAQKKGFDFYSFHLFLRKSGNIETLALGDFTVNMGQGLIQWQSLAFKKSGEVISTKRQSPVLRPYNSAGEFYFHRGAGITIRKGNMEGTVFASLRKLNANIIVDTIRNEEVVTSFLTSGNNRTGGEISDRNRLQQLCSGGNVSWRNRRLHIGLNGIYYKFSLPLSKSNDPYDLYAVEGKTWYNFSCDYSYTYRNIHLFGEVAIDKNFGRAFVDGILMSLDPRVDISILYRSIGKQYQTISGNAFTESTTPSNEEGVYAGITVRPTDAWRLDAYCDIYHFPWLKYRVDAPSYGKDFLAQLSYLPNKQTEIYLRYKNENKQGDQANDVTPAAFLIQLPKQDIRMHVGYQISRALALRYRTEVVWYDPKGKNSEEGFVAFLDLAYRPLLRPYSALIRLEYFETDGYNSRVYAYENDVLYSYSIPVIYGKGYRYYLTLNYDLTKKLSLWLRWAQVIYPGKETVGTGLDEISGNKKTEVKLQCRWVF